MSLKNNGNGFELEAAATARVGPRAVPKFR